MAFLGDAHSFMAVVGWCVLTVTVLLLCQACTVVWRSLQRVKLQEKVLPVPPGAHWLFGHTILGKELEKESLEWATEYKYAYLFKYGPGMTHCSVVHPEYVKKVFSSISDKGAFPYSVLRPWLGDGLLNSSGARWFRNRRLLTPGFHFEVLKPYIGLFSESTNVMLTKWAELGPGSSVDVFHHVSLMTLDSMLKCALGQNTDCQTSKTNNYISAVLELSDLTMQRLANLFHYALKDGLYFWLTSSGRRYKKARDSAHRYSETIIKERRETLDHPGSLGIQHGRKYLDFLDILLKAKDEDGDGLTNAEIRDEVDTFMFEGHDTTASGLSWTLYCLARHLGHQEKCRKEAQEVLQGKTEVTWDDLSSLRYITICIKESLRMYPPVAKVLRELKEPMTFYDGKTLPQGSTVFISISNLHYNPHVWENPKEFNPLRFAPENSKNRSPYAFLPFAAGQRNCIGQHFAMNELKTAVALILQRFSLTPDDTLPEPVPQYQLVTRAKPPGLFLKITPIQ
ncbi:CYP4F22 [Branchiostoma lanceolatum]|uniref:CYP4F22 protein n=2 Tax=Branchiostoma lanceolatum TaxID=7740 RepID=A0A8J9ZVC6_BRALA|nr:CYP4F22 [Branchiostoma lanceolatum]